MTTSNLKHKPATPLPCKHCGDTSGFYRQHHFQWCNSCGHIRSKRKALVNAPTTAPEIARRALLRSLGEVE